jgi:hypothetical protein
MRRSAGSACAGVRITLVLLRIDVVRDHVDVIGVAESLAEFFDERGLA